MDNHLDHYLKFYLMLDPSRGVLARLNHKAGCTMLVQAVLRSIGLLDEALRHDPWVHVYRIGPHHAAHPATLDALSDPSVPGIRTSRNPYARTVSSYFHAVVMARTAGPHLEWPRRFAGMTFREFVSELERLDLETFNPHVGSQLSLHDRTFPNRYHVVRIEDAASGLSEFNRLHGTDYSFDGLPTPSHHQTVVPAMRCDPDTRFYPTSAGVPPYRHFYDDRLLRAVRRIFSADFDAFGYPDDPPWG